MNETKDLYCFYGNNNSPWLKLGPIKVELQNKEPYVAVLRELVFEDECDSITDFLGPFLGTPPGRMGGGTGKNDWTMKKYFSDNILFFFFRIFHVHFLVFGQLKTIILPLPNSQEG